MRKLKHRPVKWFPRSYKLNSRLNQERPWLMLGLLKWFYYCWNPRFHPAGSYTWTQVLPNKKLYVNSPSARPGGCCIFLPMAAAPRGLQNDRKDGIFKNTSHLQEARRTSHFWDFHAARANFSCSLKPDWSLLCLLASKNGDSPAFFPWRGFTLTQPWHP